MKKSVAFLLSVILVLALSACGDIAGGLKDGTAPTDSSAAKQSQAVSDTQSTATITRDRAIELALEKAGLARADVRDLDAELDRDRGGVYWEVDFEAGEYEYSYDINAQTEEITEVKREID